MKHGAGRKSAQAGKKLRRSGGPAAIGHWARIGILAVLLALGLKMFVIDVCRVPTPSMENTVLPGDFLLINRLAYGGQTPDYLPFTSVRLPSLRLPPVTRPRRGDVVVFKPPARYRSLITSSSAKLVKRCVGLPGDTVRIRNRQVFINGTILPAPPDCRPDNSAVLPEGVADNRTFPSDGGFNADNYGPVVVPRAGDTLALAPGTAAWWRDVLVQEGHHVATDGSEVLVDGVPRRSYCLTEDYYFMLGDNRGNSLDSRFWGFVPERDLIGRAWFIYWSWDGAGIGFFSRLFSIRWERIGTIIR